MSKTDADKTRMTPKFRRASMIGVGIAGAFAIAVPSIAWAVDAPPSEQSTTVAIAATAITDAAVTGEQELTHEEICAQAPVDLATLTEAELADAMPAAAMTLATPALEGEAPAPTAEELAALAAAEAPQAVATSGMTEAMSC